jgi:hypothetical protein
LLFLFAWFSYATIRNGLRDAAAPWIGLACFALAFCAITTLGRIDLGINTGVLQSRYTTHELLFSAAVLVLGYLSIPDRPPLLPNLARSLILLAAGVCIALGYLDGFRQAKFENEPKSFAKQLLPFFHYFDPKTDGMATGPYYPLVPIANLRFYGAIETYDRLGFIPNAVSNPKFVTQPDGPRGTCLVSQVKDSSVENVVVSGQSRFSSDLAFLREAGGEQFIAAAAPTHQSGSGETCSWRFQLPLAWLGTNERALEVWAYDGRSNTFFMVNHD